MNNFGTLNKVMAKLWTMTKKTECDIEPHPVLPNKVPAHITHYIVKKFIQ
ncbi:MAG: hypothetical protein ACP5F6_04215 [Microbacter sp.]